MQTELSDFETRLRSSLAPAVLSNVKITIAPSAQGNPAGEIYGKVVDATTGAASLARVRFTSVTPAFKAWVTAWGSSERGAVQRAVIPRTSIRSV